MSAVTTILAAIDTAIAACIADTDDIVSYKIGEKSVNKSEKLEWLLKAREQYQEYAEKEPYESIVHVALDFDEFGIDESEYVGDAIN